MIPVFRPSAVLLLLGLSACSGAFVAAGPSLDMGTLAVSGLQGGVGGHLELGKLWQRDQSTLGAALTGAIAGYSSTADADPVFFTGLEIRSRRNLSPDRAVRPFVEAGGGPVVAWVAGPQAGGLVAHLALGFQAGEGGLPWWVAVRVRPAGLVGGDQAEFFGSAQLGFGLSLRRNQP
jgi:hypothetical protein